MPVRHHGRARRELALELRPQRKVQVVGKKERHDCRVAQVGLEQILLAETDLVRHALAGVVALSTYLPLAATLAAERSAANRSLPIFMGHGQYDDLIPLQRARASREHLEKLGYQIEWHDYPMPHSVCAPEIAEISAFLSKII